FLVEEGYFYDSSVSPKLRLLPIVPHRNGKSGIDALCRCLSTEAGTLWEVPPSTIQIAGVRMSLAGDGYFRLLPYGLLLRLLKWGGADGQPLVMCLRSWELDPDQPRMHGRLLSRLRHYVNLHKTEDRLIHLMNEFSFGPIREAIAPMRFLYEEGAEPCRTTAHSPRTKWAPSASESLSRTSKLGRGSPGPRPGKNATSSYQEEYRTMHWYAVRAKPNHERQAELSLQPLGVETFYPQMKQRRVIRRRGQMIIGSLFPGYLFARLNLAVHYRAAK